MPSEGDGDDCDQADTVQVSYIIFFLIDLYSACKVSLGHYIPMCENILKEENNIKKFLYGSKNSHSLPSIYLPSRWRRLISV